MPYMYILRCVDDSYYTGSTWNLRKRLVEHQDGLGARHTAKRLPVVLVYYEVFERVEDAFKREKQVQGWSRKKKEALIVGDTNALHVLAQCRNETHWSNAGFGSTLRQAQCTTRPAGFDSAQPASSGTVRCLSGAEGNNDDKGCEKLEGVIK